MADIRKKLLDKFNSQNAYSIFGAYLKEVEIEGFRGISNLVLKVEYPITAISGANGSGKSTIGQIAVSGYKKPITDRIYRRRYIKDFFQNLLILTQIHLRMMPKWYLSMGPILSNYSKLQYQGKMWSGQDIKDSQKDIAFI